MFGHETRPYHFFIPAILVIVGGLFMRLDTWEIVGAGIWLIAAACTFFLVYTTIKDKQLREIEQEHHHLGEIMKLDAAKTKTKVVIDKTPLTGTMHHTFNQLNIAPAKLKKFAREVVMDGKKLTIREWTPLKKGKLFSDPEWRRLIAFMKQPDWEDKRIKFIVPINPNNENDGYELTAAGRKWLNDVLSETVLSPVSA
jgi:hypothetical protein